MFCNSILAQKTPEIGGYYSALPSMMRLVMPQQSDWYGQNLLHLRFNFGWQLSGAWRFDASLRNRFIAGSKYMVQPAELSFDKGWIDAAWNCFTVERQKTVSLLNVALDRFYLTFERDRWKLQLGKQRINWGQTLVWNPDDIFNSYSFFDFDYPERPGCDAFRATFYHSETASSEFAASVNHYGKITAGLMHHWNRRNFDFQVIGGVFEQSDAVVGGAWTGDFRGLNFRGEFSVFRPFRNFADTAFTVAASVGLDYIFPNSLMLQTEILYNRTGVRPSSNNLSALLNAGELSAKMLSVCDWNIFAQISHPLTPRLNGALSGMYFADIKACYTGFSVDFSIVENLDCSLIVQYFTAMGDTASDKMQILLGFLRVKWSF